MCSPVTMCIKKKSERILLVVHFFFGLSLILVLCKASSHFSLFLLCFYRDKEFLYNTVCEMYFNIHIVQNSTCSVTRRSPNLSNFLLFRFRMRSSQRSDVMIILFCKYSFHPVSLVPQHFFSVGTGLVGILLSEMAEHTGLQAPCQRMFTYSTLSELTSGNLICQSKAGVKQICSRECLACLMLSELLFKENHNTLGWFCGG